MDQSRYKSCGITRTKQEKEKINTPQLFTNDVIFMLICTFTDKYDVSWQLTLLLLTYKEVSQSRI